MTNPMTNPFTDGKLNIPRSLITPANLSRAKSEAAKAEGLDRFEWLLTVALLEGALALAEAPAEPVEAGANAAAAEQPAGGKSPLPTPPTDPGEPARGRPARPRPRAAQPTASV